MGKFTFNKVMKHQRKLQKEADKIGKVRQVLSQIDAMNARDQIYDAEISIPQNAPQDGEQNIGTGEGISAPVEPDREGAVGTSAE